MVGNEAAGTGPAALHKQGLQVTLRKPALRSLLLR